MSDEVYKPPTVRVGDPVLWSYNGSLKDIRAFGIVTEVGERCIQITVFSKGWAAAQIKDGVYHVEDPLRLKGDRNRNGTWEESELCKDIGVLFNSCADLNKTVLRLDAKISQQNQRINKFLRGRGVADEEPEKDADTPNVPEAQQTE